MKGGIFNDNLQPATIGGRLLYLFGSTSYGNYPDIQELWVKYQKETSPKVRKELVGNIQKAIHDRTMFIPPHFDQFARRFRSPGERESL